MLAFTLVEEIGVVAGALLLALIAFFLVLFVLRPLRVELTMKHHLPPPSDASDTISEEDKKEEE